MQRRSIGQAMCLFVLLAVLYLGNCSSESTDDASNDRVKCEVGCPVEFRPVCTDRGHTASSPCVALCSGAQVVMEQPCPGEALIHKGNAHAIPPGMHLHSSSSSSSSSKAASGPSPRIWSQDIMAAYRSSGYHYLGQMGLLQYSHMRRAPPSSSPQQAMQPASDRQSWAAWINSKLSQVTQQKIPPHSSTPQRSDHPSLTESTSHTDPPPDGRHLRLLRITKDGHLYVRDLELNSAFDNRALIEVPSSDSSATATQSSSTEQAKAMGGVKTGIRPAPHVASHLAQHLLCKREAGGLSTLDEQLLASLVDPTLDRGQDSKCQRFAQDTNLANPVRQYSDDVMSDDEMQAVPGTASSEADGQASRADGIEMFRQSQQSQQRPQQQAQHVHHDDQDESSSSWPQWRPKRRQLGVFPPDHRISCPRFPTYPFSAVGQIQFQDGDKPYICSGALIGPDVVITAAHCVYDRRNKVFFGNIAFSAARFLSSSDAGIISPLGTLSYTRVDVIYGYVNDTASDPNQFDIAVLKLLSPVGYQAGWMGIRPACRPSLLGWVFLLRDCTVETHAKVGFQSTPKKMNCHLAMRPQGQSGSAIWQTEVGPDNQPAAYVRGVHNVEWTNSSGAVFINAGVAIVPDYEQTILEWIADSFAGITLAKGAPAAAIGLKAGDPFQGTGLKAEQLQQIATQV